MPDTTVDNHAKRRPAYPNSRSGLCFPRVLVAPVILVISLLPTAAVAQRMGATVEEDSGGVVLTDGGKPVLRYHYETIEPPEGYAEQLPDAARKYARARSNYIHPLYGPGGEELTDEQLKGTGAYIG